MTFIQMRSDGVHSRFLMGRIGEREGGNNSDESSSFTSIAALAKLNKRSKGEGRFDFERVSLVGRDVSTKGGDNVAKEGCVITLQELTRSALRQLRRQVEPSRLPDLFWMRFLS